jgi:hypothetical protein
MHRGVVLARMRVMGVRGTRDTSVTGAVGVKAPLEGSVVEQVRWRFAVLECVEEV